MLELGNLNEVESPEKNSLNEVPEISEVTESDTDKLEKPLNLEVRKPTETSVGDPSQKLEAVNDTNDVHDGYYSTYKERLDHTPKEDSARGEWSGERGESEFTPNDEEIKNILDENGKDSIVYKDGIPDFSDVSKSTVEIDNMTDNRFDNFRQCDEKCAEQWNKDGFDGKNDWSPRDVKNWRSDNEYSWHERNDMETCDLVPTKVNDYFGHLGGVSECKKRDADNGGSDFDE